MNLWLRQYPIHLKDGVVINDYLRVGDTVLTPLNDPFMRIISGAIGMVDKPWHDLPDKPWHMAFVFDPRQEVVCEAYWPVVRLRRIKDMHNPSIYRWFDQTLGETEFMDFIISRLGKRYDPMCYVCTAIARVSGIPLPRILNSEYTCWELNAELALWFGEPWCDLWKYPMIMDFLRAMGYLGGPVVHNVGVDYNYDEVLVDRLLSGANA